MTGIGTAVRIMTGPLPQPVVAANAASVSPTDTPGADEAIPITVSCASPIASDVQSRSRSRLMSHLLSVSDPFRAPGSPLVFMPARASPRHWRCSWLARVLPR